MNFYLVCFHENSLPKCFPIWWNLELTMFPRRRIPRFLWTKPKLDLCHKILCITSLNLGPLTDILPPIFLLVHCTAED